MTWEGNDYRNLVNEIGESKFTEALSELKKTADDFIKEAGFEPYVQCNERILLQVQLDYYTDIFRLKDFHGIENVRTEKIFAYMIAWILKRKPLQFVSDADEERDIFVNERFAAYLMMNECLLCGEKRFVGKENLNRFADYVNMVLYYFKYRETNAQVIELLIETFKAGSLVESNE